jgi:sugar lactone lactonase YvrE
MDRYTGLTTLRIGRSSASVVKGGVQTALEDEGAIASTALLFSPHGLAFDSDGNLYITESWGHTIRMVKKWW